MKLIINKTSVTPLAGETLLDLVKRLGLTSEHLSKDPIAAKIAGRVFTLNHIPVPKEAAHERGSIRKAMEATNGEVRLFYYTDAEGREAYTRTAQFALFLAIARLWPEAGAKMNCTIGSGLYIKVTNAEGFSAFALKKEVEKIVKEDICLTKQRIPTKDAIAYYEAKGQTDKARLLAFRLKNTVDIYTHGDFADYYYFEMMPSTGYLRSWDIIDAPEGFIFLFPDRQNPDRVADYQPRPNFFAVSTEGKRWSELMRCETVADLNDAVDSGSIRELIRVNEALHERRFAEIAGMITKRGAKAVMLAGPSSSGKTTSANRLATQLRTEGKRPVLISLDDYYLDRDRIPLAEDGSVDLEHINTLDLALFRKHLKELLNGETVELPHFNFKRGMREWKGNTLRLDEEAVIIIEGLHALNPTLLPDGIDTNKVFRLFVSPLLPLNLDDHNRIPTSYLRLLRRTVRDSETRGASVQDTLAMWSSVRSGEERWIFPFQESADVILNSSTLYELAVIKRHIFPLLLAIQPSDDCYSEVRAMVKVLNFVHEADVDDEIPPTSIVREFIGGNSFYRK